MARTVKRLKARSVTAAQKPGLYPDGAGLYLQVTSATARSWLFRYSMAGRERQMGLGSANDVTLAEARDLASAAHRLRRKGIDPIEHRKAEQEAALSAATLESARGISFQECGEAYVAAHEAGWRNPKHRAQWRSTLAIHVYPAIGALPVSAIDTTRVLACIEPIWHEMPETAGRVRGRIEAVLDWARVRGYREGENPARWRGHLKHTLASPAKLKRVKHHAALPWKDLPAFMERLRAENGTAARALEWTILTAARTSETTGATAGEIEVAERAWNVPAERMKAKRPHRVPLSESAIALVSATVPDVTVDKPLFPGMNPARGLSNMAMAKVLERMGVAVTVHGFRSTFRDWAEELTSYSANVIEMALAHIVKDETEAAYRRGDLFEKRRALMDDWARYCRGKTVEGANVVQLRAAS